MKRIYITAIPLDSNFAITPYAAEPVNYTQTTTQPTCYPITPILADTAHDGDEIKVIAVRQVNSPHSENLEVFRRELDSLGKPYTLVDLTTPENQQRDGLLTLFEALTDAMESDACYYADATFGTKTYPLVLSSALHYAEKILDDTEVCGIYYRELTRESGQVKNARQYDISTLFTLDGIVDMAADAELTDKKAFIKLMLHPRPGGVSHGGLRKRQRETGRSAPSDREAPDLAVPAGGASAAQPRVAELVSARV